MLLMADRLDVDLDLSLGVGKGIAFGGRASLHDRKRRMVSGLSAEG